MESRRIDIADGGLLLWPDAFAADAEALAAALREGIEWTQHRVRLFGREHAAPRLSAWFAAPGCRYRYSGITLEPVPFPAMVANIGTRIEALTGASFNSVLLNRYRDGRDGMGWHADDERELGPAPVIASLSLGSTRRFVLRHRKRREQRVDIELASGALLLMEPPLQAHWLHALPKTARPAGERINLTWRRIVQPAQGDYPV